MTPPRLARSAACLVLLLGVLTAAAPAADPASAAAPKWDPARTTPPEDLNELKALQAAVKGIVDRCTPATVAVLYPPPPTEQGSAGSGVIVSPDGLVLTAAHVIRDYDKPKRGSLEGKALPFTAGKVVALQLPDGTRVKAKTLGINAGEDSGMIQITDKGPNDGKWPFAPVVKSGDVQKGQWVVSLGHPSGPKEGRSPVARLGRVLSNDRHSLRTDCTLVGGDSGGPLFDLQGRVIGIHSRIGMGLALNYHVPTDQFKNDWDKLVAGEWVDKPASAKTNNAYIGVVFPEDDDSPVKSVKQFRRYMDAAKPGDKVRLGVRRGVSTLTLPATLGKK
jgi:serine protease Do